MATLFWDPPREAFVIPYLDLPIYWYSLFFAFGFLVGYWIVFKLVRPYFATKALCHQFIDSLAWYIFIGMLVGARLGHVFFYDWENFSHHLSDIPMTRKGGLSSHGAVVGILISYYFFWKRHLKENPPVSWVRLLDVLSVGACFAGGCIRIGNFFNQEILGTESTLPWAVQFGHPVDNVTSACHPAQLYEAIFYFLVCIVTWVLLRQKKVVQEGFVFGLFLTLVFTFRFFIEWIKIPQEVTVNGTLNMGQLLSLPLIGLGVYFLMRKKK